MRRAIPTAYTPGAYGWSSQIGTLKSAADGSLWVTIEDDAFTRLDSRARALFVATDADIAAWLAASEAVIDGSG